MYKTTEKKIVEILLILLCIIIILPLLIISAYNRPSADDYDYAILTHQVVKNGGNIFELLGAAFKTTVKFYNSWQGLYTSAFILSLQPAIFGENFYAFSAPIVMLFAFVCLFISINILNKHFLKRSRLFSATAATILLTTIILWLPSSTEGLFWFNGAMNYMPFVFLDLLNLCVLLEAYKSPKKTTRYILIGVCTLLSFLISGGNHVTSFANILLLLTVTLFLVYFKRNFYYTLFPFASAIIGFLIMYLAPGTAIRQTAINETTPNSQGLFDTIFQTINHMRHIFGDWISLIWLLSLIIITPIAIELAIKNKELFSKRFPFLSIVISTAIICAMFCVPYLPMGYFGEPRVTNVIWIMFMFLSWFNYILVWGFLVKNEYFNTEIITKLKFGYAIKIGLIVISLLALFLVQDGYESSNSYEAVEELSQGIAQQYCKEMDNRIELFNNPEINEAAVPALTTKSDLLFFADFGTNPDVWPNTSISEYYNKKIYLIP